MSNAYRDRLLPPDEVRRVLQRAAALQDASANATTPAGRPQTLAEVEQIARDAGISDEALARALAESQHGDKAGGGSRSPGGSWFTGAPSRIVIERTVPGVVASKAHGTLVKAMRRAIGEVGTAQTVGDSLSWSTNTGPNAGRRIQALIEQEGDAVTVRVDENLQPLRGGLFGGILGGVGGGGLGMVVPFAASMSTAMTPLFIALWVIAVYAIARYFYVSRYRTREKELRELADEVTRKLSAEVRVEVPGTARVATAEDEVALEADAADDVLRAKSR